MDLRLLNWKILNLSKLEFYIDSIDLSKRITLSTDQTSMRDVIYFSPKVIKVLNQMLSY